MTRQKRQSILISMVRLIADFSEKKVGNFASSTAFFFFISLIPFCILLSTLLPLTGIDKEMFVEFVVSHTPDIVDGIVRSIIEDAFASSGTVFSLSLLAILYASGKGMIALMQGLNVVYGIKEHRSYPRIACVAVTYMVLLMGFIIISLLLGVFGEMLATFIAEQFPQTERLMTHIMGMRLFVIIALSVILFLLMYTYVPAKNQVLVQQFPGTIFAMVGWMVFSKFFTIAMSHGSIYSTYYGSLAAIVIFMLWMYGCFYILLIGGYINVIFSKNQKKR